MGKKGTGWTQSSTWSVQCHCMEGVKKTWDKDLGFENVGSKL